MLNIEKYKDEIKNYIENGYDFQDTLCSIYCDKNQHDASDLDVLDWLCEEYQEPILDEKEKKYLSAVIKPFRNRIVSIAKIKDWIDENSNLEVVEIVLKLPNKYQDLEYVQLPYFEKDTMYKNMKANKRYTLEELGL